MNIAYIELYVVASTERFSALSIESRMDFGVKSVGVEIKLFPPPAYNGEIHRCEDWSWQLQRYVGLYKPLAMRRNVGLNVSCDCR